MTIAHRTFAVAALGLVLGCGGRQQVAAAPSPASPEATIELFLDAVNASDLDRMATLWGTEQGSAAATGMPLEERNQRLAIMQRLLRNDSRRLVSTENTIPTAPVRSYEIVQGERRFVVPFTCVPSRHGGWLINQIGLDAAMPTAGPRNR